MRADVQELDLRREGQASWRSTAKPISIKVRSVNSSGFAQKVSRLTPGDLFLCSEVGTGLFVRRVIEKQKSAAGIVER